VKVAFVLTQDRGGPVDLTVGMAIELAGRSAGPEVTVVGPPPVSSAGAVRSLRRPVEVRKVTDARAGAELRRALAELEPDLVHAQDRRAGLFAATVARGRAPVVATYHGVPDAGAGGWVRQGPLAGRRPPAQNVVRLVADAAVGRLVDMTVAPSRAMAGFLVGYLRMSPRKVTVIHNGVRPVPARPLSGPARVFATVGSFDRSKSVPLLIDAFAQLACRWPDVRLLLIGDGEERVRVERQVAAMGLGHRVELLGYRRDVRTQLSRADAFVLPSINENLPLALLEAMSAGLACVASDVGGIPEVLTDGAGLLVPPGDVTALSRAMARLASEPGLAPALGRAAAAVVRERFTVAACADAHLALWAKLLGGRRR
jgi:glycosyltransferase involved in cell wall biosynthesis